MKLGTESLTRWTSPAQPFARQQSPRIIQDFSPPKQVIYNDLFGENHSSSA